MKIDWKGLLQGIYNSALGKNWIRDLANYRYNFFCKACEYNSTVAKAAGKYNGPRPDEHCTACGCNLEWKTHQLSSSCPKGKWPAEVTREEAEQLRRQISSHPKTS